MYGVVYLILNKINGRKYVGQTVQPLKVRFKEHAKKKTIRLSPTRFANTVRKISIAASSKLVRRKRSLIIGKNITLPRLKQKNLTATI